MKENLKTTKFRNGTNIPLVVNNTDWSNLTTAAWSYYNNDETNNSINGKLYNSFATIGDSICPNGFRISTESDWVQLFSNFEQDLIPSLISTDGFCLSLGGYRLGLNGQFTSTTTVYFSPSPGEYGTTRGVRFSSNSFDIIANVYPQTGYYIRCIKK